MKPSKKYLHDDNSSSATTSTSYWNNLNIIKWNRESIVKTVNYIDKRLLIRIIAACFMIALIAIIVSSSPSPSKSSSIQHINNNINTSIINDTENAEQRQRLLININKATNNISNDSIIDTSTRISIIEVTVPSQQPPLITTNNNIIASQNSDYSKKSNDEVTLTKNYVSLIMQFIAIHSTDVNYRNCFSSLI